jgi:hypothetical protein
LALKVRIVDATTVSPEAGAIAPPVAGGRRGDHYFFLLADCFANTACFFF